MMEAILGKHAVLIAVLTALPTVLLILLLTRYSAWRPKIPAWRMRAWLVGALLLLAMSFNPLWMLIFAALKWHSYFKYMPLAAVPALLMATLLIAFGAGKLRWFGLLSCVWLLPYVWLALLFTGWQS